MIKVAITDDHPLVREGLISLLQSQASIHVIAAYENGNYLVEGLKQQQPDVLLLDLQLSNGPEGKDLVILIKNLYPGVRIIILTSNDNAYNIQLLLNSGADGYILKSIEQRLLIEAIEKVYQGESYLSPEIKDLLLSTMRKSSNTLQNNTELTTREMQILQLIAEELTSQEIASRLHLSARTVETYRLGIMQKLGVKNMVGMTKKAIMLGIIK
jgi:DNA-binding NarL/FixJ family response regulator